MADQATQDPPQTSAPDPDKAAKKDDYGKPPTLEEVKELVFKTVQDAVKPLMDKLGGGQAAPPAGPATQTDAGDPPDLAAMVSKAVETVLGDKAKDDADAAHRKQHEQLAALAERPPVERPTRSRWLGNIYDR